MSQKEISLNANLVIAEYNSLRNEILKRIEFRFQIINLTIIAAGTFLTVGVQDNIPASVLFIYPILAFFLAASWSHNGAMILLLEQHIKINIEAKNPDLKWETHGVKPYSLGWLSTLSTSGLILVTQIIAIALALLKTLYTPVELVLLVCSVITVILTVLILGFRKYVKQQK
jgi:hypothetical protein